MVTRVTVGGARGLLVAGIAGRPARPAGGDGRAAGSVAPPRNATADTRRFRATADSDGGADSAGGRRDARIGGGSGEG